MGQLGEEETPRKEGKVRKPVVSRGPGKEETPRKTGRKRETSGESGGQGKRKHPGKREKEENQW